MTAEFLPVVGGNIGSFDIFFERPQMKTEPKSNKEGRKVTKAVRRRLEAAVERMMADKRKGDVVAYLRDFRASPRGG